MSEWVTLTDDRGNQVVVNLDRAITIQQHISLAKKPFTHIRFSLEGGFQDVRESPADILSKLNGR
jgi:hypothetical protein